MMSRSGAPCFGGIGWSFMSHASITCGCSSVRKSSSTQKRSAPMMVRVTKPGGRIVMGNWIPNDPTFVSQVLKISSAFTPPPPEGFVSPMTWGVENNIIERFGQAGVPAEKITMVKDTYYFAHPDKSPAQF